MAKHKQKSLNKIQWLKDIRIAGAKLRNNVWKERYLSIVNTPKRLLYWQQKEKDFLNRLVVVNNEQLAKNDNPSVKKARSWLKEIWPFGEHCERIYKFPADLDAIYLAVGLRLDVLYRARVFVTEEMVKVIVGEWQFAVKRRISELNVFLCFGPCFEGIYIAYDDPLETFWGYIEADLKAKGLLRDKSHSSTKKAAKKKKNKTKKFEDDSPCYLWQKKGQDSHGKNLWRVKYDNKEGVFSLDFCETIFRLLQQPNQPLLLTDLDNELENSLNNPFSDQPVADKLALREYSNRLNEIESDLTHAKKNNDEANIGTLEKEKNELLKYIKQARGPQGQSKSIKSRKNLIKNSKDKFQKQQKRLLEAFVNSDLRVLSTHFTRAISWEIDKKIGLPAIKYTPESHISWKFSP